MISEQLFRGGAVKNNGDVSGVVILGPHSERFLRLDNITDLTLPNSNLLHNGHTFIIHNVNTTTDIKLSPDGLLAKAPFRKITVLILQDNTITDGAWFQYFYTPPLVGGINEPDAIVVGGSASIKVNSAYNFAGNTWSAKTSSPRDRDFSSAFLQGDRYYVCGKYPANADGLKTDEYSAATNAWRNLTDCPFNPARGTSGYTHEVGVIMSGDSSVDVVSFTRFAWTTKRNTGIARPRSASARSSGKIFWIPGEPQPISGLYYDPITDVFITLASYSGTARYNVSCFAINNRIVVCGGKLDASTADSTVEEYSPAGKSWTTKTPLPMGARHAAATFHHNNFGYYCCGANGSDTAQPECSKFAINTWTSIASLGTRWGMSNQGASR